MKERQKEQVSSLLDNELEMHEVDELISVLENDAELNAQIDRYALIREAVFKDDIVIDHEAFLKNIKNAITPTLITSIYSQEGSGVSYSSEQVERLPEDDLREGAILSGELVFK